MSQLAYIDDVKPLTLVKPAVAEVKGDIYPAKPPFEENPGHLELALDRMTRKSMYILRLLCEGGNRSTMMTSHISQVELARKLHVTRQALSVHLKRLSELSLVQVGRGFVNVTEDGLRAAGYHRNPAILIVRFAPQKQLEAVEKMRKIPSVEAFRVAGDADFAIFTEQENLDRTLAHLYSVDGILEVRTLIATEVLKHINY
ncbi:MAG: Lrp/AsnC family transcriptional regulator [Candidatus Bathyarchaeia archaeon]|jgi:DNA-binding MarR family transcriptional regulator